MRSAQQLLLTLALMLLIPLASLSTIHRVNNTPEAGIGTFPSLTAALADVLVVTNDTILVESSDIIYDAGGVTVDKRVKIFGTGYYLEDNPCTQADTRPSTFDSITFASGSEGAVLGGVTVSTIRVTVGQVRIIRCNITEWIGLGTNGNISNCHVAQCFIEGTSDSLVSIINCSNYVLRNNLIHNEDTGCDFILKVHEGSGLVLNNIFKGGNPISLDNLILKNATVQNNQFAEHATFNTGTSSNVTAHNCISEDDFLNSYGGIGNNHVIEILTVEGYSIDSLNCHSVMLGESRDGVYQMNSTWTDVSHLLYPNPAFNTGVDGRHIGLAGGTDPYVLSGMPPVPSVAGYAGSASGTPSGGANATVKGKSRK
jgi:hypothetical protein